MKTHTQVAVIGGGIAGCATLYELTQHGITDCVLLERDELTSGTTWHSAAQVTNFGPNQTMLGLKSHSIKLYSELAADPDYPINYHHGTGGLRLATTQDHLDGYHHFISQAKGMGVDFELLDPQESQRRHPLISTEAMLGALWDPHDGYIDPAQLCQALARRARKAGAQVTRQTEVQGLRQRIGGAWQITTNQGVMEAEILVNAGGYRCNEIAALMEVVLPVASMEHQYMLTDPIPQIAALKAERGAGWEVPLIRCPQSDFYQRAEKDGLLIGFYEQDCKPWGLDGIDPSFTMALCPDDLDRVADVMMGAIARMPCLETAGIATIVNGPITYTPDGLPLVGPITGKQNAYAITGLRAGLGEGGGHGWLLAQMIASHVQGGGDACYDTWCLDPRRFSRHHTVEYTALKAIEDYQNEFRFHMPHEHRPAGRPLKTSPLTRDLAELGAEFAVVAGWERAAYYKLEPEFRETHSFKFNETHAVVAAEVANVQTNVGLMEVNGFNRIELSGPGVHDFLEGLMCSRVLRQDGKVSLNYFLNERGMVKGEATLANLGHGRVWYGSAAAAEQHDWDWLAQRLPGDGSVQMRSLTNSHDTLVIAGPRSRDVLKAAAPRTDWDAFKWLRCQRVSLGPVEAVAMAVSFSGELAWELHVANESVQQAWTVLWAAGTPYGMKPFGLYSTESMRLEKGYGHWKADFLTEFDPYAHGLDRFVTLDKAFVGKSALLARAAPQRRLVTLALDCDFATAQGGDSLLVGDRVVGTVTSAAYGHRTGTNILRAFLDVGVEACDAWFLGQRFPAKVVDPCLYDPDNRRVKGDALGL